MLKKFRMLVATIAIFGTFAASALEESSVKLRRVEYKSEVAYPQIDGLYNPSLQKGINEYIKTQIDQFWPATVEARRIVRRKFDYETPFANDKVLSVKVHYQFSESEKIGSVFGLKSLNIDLKNGEEIPLLALFQNKKAAFSKLNKMVQTHLKEKVKMVYEEAIKPISGVQPYYLTPDSLVIYFNPEEVAAKIEGVVEIKIPLASLKSSLNVRTRRMLE